MDVTVRSSAKGRSRRLNNKGVGLLAIWVTAILSILALYICSSLILPLIGIMDYNVNSLMMDPNLIFKAEWVDTYNSLIPTLRDGFSYLALGCLVSIILFVIINSARREPNDYEA